MQITVLVLIRQPKGSFRDAIVRGIDADPDEIFTVNYTKKRGRRGGWAKVSLPGSPGVVNIGWDGASGILTCRALTRGQNSPEEIVANFVYYLLRRHCKKISSIIVKPT